MMATLLQIAARKIKEFPAGCQRLSQRSDGLIVAAGGYGFMRDVAIFDIAEDRVTSTVTRAQWEAERARIAAQSVSMSDEDVAFVKSDFYRDMVDRKIEQELADIACGKRSKEDQALWDKVAITALNGMLACPVQPQSGADMFARDSATLADAFMAERAKRMKG